MSVWIHVTVCMCMHVFAFVYERKTKEYEVIKSEYLDIQLNISKIKLLPCTIDFKKSSKIKIYLQVFTFLQKYWMKCFITLNS